MTMYTWDFLGNFQNCELRTIVIPGSHDAGLAGQYAESLGVFVKSMTVTQSEHVGMQALKGSRFFDVRIMLKGKELTSYHSVKDSRWLGGKGQSFESILNDLCDFVRGNPSEFVIIRLSHLQDSKNVFEALRDWIDSNQNYVYKGTGNLATKKVSELAGKVVLIIEAKKLKANKIAFGNMSRIPNQKDGFHCFYQNKKGALPDVTDGLCVCGEFSNKKSLQDVVRKQVDNYSRHDQHRNCQGSQAHLYSVYWTATGGNIEENTKKQLTPINFRAMMKKMNLDPDKRKLGPLSNIKDWSDYITQANDARKKYAIKSISMPNVILYDFIREEISREIIGLNDLIGVSIHQ